MGKVKEKTAGRATTVKVDHTLCGRSFCIGYVSKDGRRYMSASLLSREDIELIQKLYGANPEDLLNHPNVIVRDRSLSLAIENPTVRWPGVGGYWHEVDINDVTPAQAPGSL